MKQNLDEVFLVCFGFIFFECGFFFFFFLFLHFDFNCKMETFGTSSVMLKHFGRGAVVKAQHCDMKYQRKFGHCCCLGKPGQEEAKPGSST